MSIKWLTCGTVVMTTCAISTNKESTSEFIGVVTSTVSQSTTTVSFIMTRAIHLTSFYTLLDPIYTDNSLVFSNYLLISQAPFRYFHQQRRRIEVSPLTTMNSLRFVASIFRTFSGM